MALRTANPGRAVALSPQTVVAVYAYFRVMCWGHGEDTFQFRHLKNGDVSELETVVVRTSQVGCVFAPPPPPFEPRGQRARPSVALSFGACSRKVQFSQWPHDSRGTFAVGRERRLSVCSWRL